MFLLFIVSFAKPSLSVQSQSIFVLDSAGDTAVLSKDSESVVRDRPVPRHWWPQVGRAELGYQEAGRAQGGLPGGGVN